ncbi:adenylate/guanylate cyclase domain-containing protein [Vineibacter terrae]|uniref:adenylate/guanylate cyclase domain-containing protein n=1 Tax=Vineibacter terrae TaxID=2586908 RepID=UPI002E374F3F|nr:adenylate/guanylate cyclase domain-containing protein [Vineibacter terrae]HEX2885589.1 adenylate/guanylate cyclase domain-containing protein [Vineibacter terrae]
MSGETRYAKSGDVHIAYQVTGNGPVDVLLAPGFVSHVEHAWEEPLQARALHAMASFSRLIRFDKRGTGLSDRSVGMPTMEERIDDIRAVLDAAGSQRAILAGVSEGGAMCAVFAATYPERVAALILYGAYAHAPSAVVSPQTRAALEAAIHQNWGTGASLPQFSPSVGNDPEMRAWWAKFERLAASPAAVIALRRMNVEIDIRHILPTIRVPTLILHRTGDVRINVSEGRYLARTIPGAKLVELPGVDHHYWVGEAGRLLDEVKAFLDVHSDPLESNRVLSTVLFTDIVDSTGKASLMGDTGWRATLEAHHEVVRQQLRRFRGREVKTLGDGFLAMFDGPARAVRCAQAIVGGMRPLDLTVRAGLHTGEVELMEADVGGIAVHVASRIAHRAEANQILTSNTVKDLVAGSGLRFRDLGAMSFDGLDDPVRLYQAEPLALAA